MKRVRKTKRGMRNKGLTHITQTKEGRALAKQRKEEKNRTKAKYKETEEETLIEDLKDTRKGRYKGNEGISRKRSKKVGKG